MEVLNLRLLPSVKFVLRVKLYGVGLFDFLSLQGNLNRSFGPWSSVSWTMIRALAAACLVSCSRVQGLRETDPGCRMEISRSNKRTSVKVGTPEIQDETSGIVNTCEQQQNNFDPKPRGRPSSSSLQKMVFFAICMAVRAGNSGTISSIWSY